MRARRPIRRSSRVAAASRRLIRGLTELVSSSVVPRQRRSGEHGNHGDRGRPAHEPVAVRLWRGFVKIVTIIKQVPDAEARVRVDGGAVDLSGVTFVMDGMDEYGVEEAIRLREAGHEVDIVAVALGPERYEDAIRTALALGADRAVHVETDEQLDPVAQARVLAAVVREEAAELVLDEHLGITDALMRCRDCGRFYLLEMLDWRERRRVMRVAPLETPAAERLIRDLTRGSCDVNRAGAEVQHVRTATPFSRVLLLVDSVTRFARALRDVGLAVGEPPARRGFPPSVFSALPRLFERAGNNDRGSITAFYTVLAEDEDGGDPIVEEVRSILDGHIVLSRKLAAAYHYPAIDVLVSLSRTMPRVVDQAHLRAAGQLRKLLAKYQDIELLIQLGEYKRGTDPDADAAIEKIGAIRSLLQQSAHELVPFGQSADALRKLFP